MRFTRTLLLFLTLGSGAVWASGLNWTLDFSSGTGAPTSLPPSPDTCLAPNCVIFSGTLTDTDTDDSVTNLDSIDVSFSTLPAAGGLSIDNTFSESAPGILFGDTSLFYQYSGPIFGIDIAPGTTDGVYSGTVTLHADGGTNDPTNAGFTLTQDITVIVTPEPSALAQLLAAGMFAVVGMGLRKCWRTSAPSR